VSMFKEGEEDDERFDREEAPITCPIGEREDCKFFKFHRGCRGSLRFYYDDSEYWCEHPDLDDDIVKEYCPIIVEQAMEEWE